MAVVTADNANNNFDMFVNGLMDFFADPDAVTATANSITSTIPTGETVTASGTLIISDGEVIGGTVTAIEAFNADGDLYRIEGLSIDALDVLADIESAATQNESWITIFGGDDSMLGGEGIEYFWGAAGNDTILGKGGEDTIDGGDGADVIYGNLGDDMLFGNSFGGPPSNDTIFGGQGDDVVIGDWGDDALYGNLGNDVIIGSRGNDVLYGGQGLDDMSGDEGDDTLFGNRGDDTMDGGEGADTHVLAGEFGNDIIVGYDAAEDRIELRGGVSVVSIEEDLSDTIITFSSGTVTLIGIGAAGVEDSIVFAP